MSDLAIITGASSGIGLELARCAASDGYALLICADDPRIHEVAEMLRANAAAEVEAVQADLSTRSEVARLLAQSGNRPPALLMANAGIGLGEKFLDQDIAAALNVINTNVGGTLALVHEVGRQMRRAGEGRILITGSIAGYMPGSFQAVYNGTKAFLDSFSYALRDELLDSGVTVTCLMPGPTDTEFFDRANMTDTPIGSSNDKDDPAKVARTGYAAMRQGESGVVPGFMNKVQTVFAGLLPETLLARMHRRMARPER
ncbi:SDR family oxidoreductase [Salipiger sp. PrR007]|uniref:SDR family NAD(P)-dependent oxidoreductase n=1 Tax=Salipiger sp. PrR007 TaxID=2706884 RepID=UPI0013BA364B|nr:SDR family NAD(P)-dependent oxidoreductase [Salipiger sp. PrR007]NDW32768.1 SDR family NAD(P)-dependent oxidoreductase [Salipiger sp. PrR007]